MLIPSYTRYTLEEHPGYENSDHDTDYDTDRSTEHEP